jgi:hypothetical protein
MVTRFSGRLHVDPVLSGDQVLWRYMDFATFASMLAESAIFLRRGDCFADRFEGAFTRSVRKKIEESIQKNSLTTSYEQFKEKLRQRVFISCWHASIDDSMAMWSIYGKGKLSVAATTTVRQLATEVENVSLPYMLAIEKVKYIRHWRNPRIVIRPYSNVFKYKTKAYSFEKEARLIVDKMDENWNGSVIEDVFRLPVRLNNLLRSFVISPEAPSWFHSVVDSIASKYNVDSSKIHRSKMSFDPE